MSHRWYFEVALMESGVGVADGGCCGGKRSKSEMRSWRILVEGGVQAQSTLSAAEVDSDHGSVDNVGDK